MSDEESGAALVDLLARLREDIDAARAHVREDGGEPQLKIGKVEVTIQFVVEKKKGGGFRLAIPFIGASAGADASVSRSAADTQTITLELLPTGDFEVAGGRAGGG